MKIHVVSVESKPVASNYSHGEFLAEAYARFPQPSPFLAEFLQRYEALAELDAAVEKRHHEEQTSHEVECPACGHQLTIEVERESL